LEKSNDKFDVESIRNFKAFTDLEPLEFKVQRAGAEKLHFFSFNLLIVILSCRIYSYHVCLEGELSVNSIIYKK